jgi:predicted O-methyltransferase YrrM
MLTQQQALDLVLEAFAKLGMTQSGLEARDFIQFLSDKEITNILELGTCAGGLTFLMDKVSKPGLRISMDMPWDQRDPAMPSYQEAKLKALIPNLTEILGQIHDTINRTILRNILVDQQIDLLMIDADHSYEGGKKHWQMYSSFVRSGGFVAFHDIRNGWPVGRFYDELCSTYSHWEFTEEKNLYGIGVIQV